MNKNQSFVPGLIVFGLLFVSVVLNVVWFPVSAAAKVWFFERAAVAWLISGIVSTAAVFKYIGPPPERSYQNFLVTVLFGPVALVAVYRHVVGRKG